MTTCEGVIEFIADLFTPKKKKSVWQWCEDNILLSARISPHPGPYRTDWCPYVRAPQEDFTDPSVRDIILCWGSRSSKTETAINCFRYAIAEVPEACMVVMPNTHLARSFSETRFQPAIDDCPILSEQKPINSDKYKLLEMHFNKCTVWMIGANSPANLKGRGVTYLFCDEIDTWPQATEKETGALEQVLERTKDRRNRKHILTSTPTVDSGQIWKEFKLGDQRYYFVPCPHCGFYQTFKIKQLKWEEEAKTMEGEWDLARVKKNTWYECEKCSEEIRDAHKPEMLKLGEWRATAKNKEPGRRSYHLNSLYPVWIPFSDVSVMFLQSKTSVESLKRFVNSWLAEPFFSYGDNDELMQKLDNSKLETQVEGVPSDYRVLISTDVQHNHLYFVARAWSKEKESFLLDYGMIPGFEELLMVANKWKATAGFIDSAFRPQIILDFCGKNLGWIPVLGSPLLYTPMRWSDIPIDGGLMKGHVVKTLRFRANDWKETLNDRIHGKGPKWSLPPNIGEDYKKQMAGEHRMEKKGPRGVTMIEWVKHGPNHYWDCEVIQTVAFEALRPILFEISANENALPPQLPKTMDMAMDEIRQPIRRDDDMWTGTRGLSW
jgi:phage terminase large subunit GpA-like protein